MKDDITIGMDLGDKFHIAVVFDGQGNELEVARINNTKHRIHRFFARYQGSTVAIEAGTHSPWISRALEQINCRVFVGNPRQLRFIWDSKDKSDERDARMLGMVCRIEPRLLSAIKHRGLQAQADLAMIKTRNALVKTRTSLINHARGLVKSNGARLDACSAGSFARRCSEQIPAELAPALEPIIKTIAQLTEQIKTMDRKLDELSQKRYPETELLKQVSGVGPVTALCYVLTVDDPNRFAKSRQLGPFLGLTPRRDQSGNIDKQLHISKAGNSYLRKLLVGCAQYILGPFGPGSNLRSYGMTIAARGGKNAKKRAAVAVARKLAVLLHRLWVTKQQYEPFYGKIGQKAA